MLLSVPTAGYFYCYAIVCCMDIPHFTYPYSPVVCGLFLTFDHYEECLLQLKASHDCGFKEKHKTLLNNHHTLKGILVIYSYLATTSEQL